ncbi:MAG: PEP-CTERM sorting domain-containing protein, partial [Verrucomicrobiota bacterium]
SVSSLSLNSGAHVAITIGGTGAGLFTQVKSSGSVTLGNAIAGLDLTVGYTPSVVAGNLASSDHIYITLGSYASGTFSNTTSLFDPAYGQTFNYVTASNGSVWAVFYGANSSNGNLTGGNDIALYAIPEPGTWAMLLSGFGVLLGLQRMRKNRVGTR